MLMRASKFLLLFLCLLLSSNTTYAHDNLLLRRKQDMKDGGHTSPDGKFLLNSRTGDAEIVRITVREKKHPDKILFQSPFVEGFSWLPNKEHQLVFAVATDNNGETPGIFLWQKGQRLLCLKAVKGDQNVGIYGITPKGDKLAYKYWPDLMEQNPARFGPFIKSLKLP